MAQFLYQLHGMFEMHFFAFIGSALLITYQNWKLQLPLWLLIVLQHALVFQDLPTFVTHTVLTGLICFISGLCAFQLHQYHQIQLVQNEQLSRLQAVAQHTDDLKERNQILESIGEAFFALDTAWAVTYWNRTAEKALQKTRQEMLGQNLWAAFPTTVDSVSYRKYHQAVKTRRPVHFEDYFAPLDRWYEVSAFPSPAGLSVYFKDISERKKSISDLKESEQRYSDVFHFSPLPIWMVNLRIAGFYGCQCGNDPSLRL